MKKHLYVMMISLLVLGGHSMQANAGIWDSITSFFSDEEESSEAVETPEGKTLPKDVSDKATDGSTTSAMMKKGLEYLPLITEKLGITSAQASGGSGALMKAAQALLSKSDFGTISKSFPGMSSMLSSAPAVESASEEKGGLLDSAVKSAVDSNPTAKAGSELLSQFKSLGLSADMIPKFTEVASGYLKKSDNSEGADLLTSALSKIM